VFFSVILFLGIVCFPLVFLVLGLVALLRCEREDVPKVVQALHFDKFRQ
jgi:hypothetical protein